MTSVNGGNERLVTVHDLGVGDASNLVVTLAQEQGYSVAATGQGQFRMVRQKRPVWAVVAAILTFPFLGVGLLFLLVKRTDSGSVAVFEGRDGTKVRFVGAIDDEIVESVTSPADKGASRGAKPPEDSAVLPKQDRPQEPSHKPFEPRDRAQSTDITPVTAQPATPVANTTPPVAESAGLIDSSPIAKPAQQTPTTGDRDFEKTVARSSLTPPPVAGAIIDLPDGRSIPVSDGIVIGRSPSSPNGRPVMREVPYPDSSLSKTHLTIEPGGGGGGGGVVVTDLHSTNGTTILKGDASRSCPPGEAVGAVAGSEIRAGDVIIRVKASR